MPEFSNRKDTKMINDELSNFIHKKAKDLKIDPIDFEGVVGETLTTAVKNRIRNYSPERQSAEILMLIATILCCFGIEAETLRNRGLIDALKAAQQTLEKIEILE